MWGDGSRYSYNLAEKVWMTLGLSPRVIGNDVQKIIYDDLSLPIIGVSEGDVASEFEFNLKRDVYWTMRNDYLRKYLWMTGCYGVRVFFYEAYIINTKKVSQSPPFLLSKLIQIILTQPSSRVTEHPHPRAILIPLLRFPAMVIRF